MSADNWRTCPKCLAKAKESYETQVADVQKVYGKVSAADYQKLLEKLKEIEKSDRKMPKDLREDYCLGITDSGVMRIDYSASCQTCGFSYRFKKDFQAYPEVKEPK